MSELYPRDWLPYLNIAGICLRLLGLFVAAPIFSHRAIPLQFKLLFALSFSLALYPILKTHLPVFDVGVLGIVTLALRETAIGLLMGFAISMTFEAVNLAAHFVGYQMGFGTIGLMDPQSSSQVSGMVPLHGWLAILIFFVGDMHHDVLQAFTLSFQATSAHLDVGNMGLFQYYVTLTAKLFWLSIRLAAPFTLLLLGCQVGLGVLARLLPQMNLILFSFPITILVGLGSLYLLAPEYLSYLELVLADSSTELVRLIKLL